MVGGIIAKLPPSWKDFATSLKHQRKEFGLAELMGTLDVEEKALSLLVPMWCKRKGNSHSVIKKRTSKRTSKGQI